MNCYLLLWRQSWYSADHNVNFSPAVWNERYSYKQLLSSSKEGKCDEILVALIVIFPNITLKNEVEFHKSIT